MSGTAGYSQRAFRGGDIRETLLFGLSAASVRVVPERFWPGLCDFFHRAVPRGSSDRYIKFRSAVRAVLGDSLTETEIVSVFARSHAHQHRKRFYIAALRAGRPWTPTFEFEGLDRLENSRQSGVVLWFDNFAHLYVLGKMAFARRDHPMWYLSSHMHGLSGTKYGVKHLNPLQVSVEQRYLAGRIAFDHRSVIAAARRIVEVLDNDGTVGITNNANFGKQIEVALGPEARLLIATGPFKLAARSGVSVFPVTVIELDALRRYRVTIGPRIVAEGRTVYEMAAEYSDYLLPIVRAHPDQWLGWRAIGNAIAASQKRR